MLTLLVEVDADGVEELLDGNLVVLLHVELSHQRDQLLLVVRNARGLERGLELLHHQETLPVLVDVNER